MGWVWDWGVWDLGLDWIGIVVWFGVILCFEYIRMFFFVCMEGKFGVFGGYVWRRKVNSFWSVWRRKELGYVKWI